ncbi:MAG TPA: hypothetical protein VN256_05570 [Pyrinomonadaceae bacterium]|nr:hypothetical protein [Pyrinomonadaceae bacterium]
MEDQDSKATLPAHSPGTRKGEDIKDKDGTEAGRWDSGTTGADRPSGESDARDSTAINPDDVESTSGGPSMPPA